MELHLKCYSNTHNNLALKYFIDFEKNVKCLLEINSKKYIDKSMDREVLPENEDVVTGKLRE